MHHAVLRPPSVQLSLSFATRLVFRLAVQALLPTQLVPGHSIGRSLHHQQRNPCLCLRSPPTDRTGGTYDPKRHTHVSCTVECTMIVVPEETDSCARAGTNEDGTEELPILR